VQLLINTLTKLNRLPIFWVVLSLALVISPHLTRFPGWAILLIIFLFSWRLFCIFNPHFLPPKWLLVIITLPAIFGIYFSFGTLFGKTAGSILLTLLLAIKLHESQSRRDYMLLISLSFFIIVTNFLFSQSIPTVIFMLLAVIVLIISMISISQGSAPLTFKYKFKFASKLLLLSLPLMLIMFVLFPRIPGPLWQLPNEKQSTLSGLSDKMSPGNISNLIQSNAVAFRAKFNGKIPSQNKLYWRALVLWYFDGQTWEQGNENLSPTATISSLSETLINYTITLEPHNRTWLYALDVPYKVPAKIHYTNNFNLRSQQKISSLFQYSVSSILNYQIQLNISPWEKSAGLNIPYNTNPITVDMGQKLSQRYKRPEQIISHVLQLFNQQNFHYTLRPPLTPGFDSVDQFLFETKRGFCEHYASSFTLLMRAAGIPARVVMGFQGGTINPLNQVMTVRNSDAHAWSEVWLKNKGWVRIDPTASIAPQRVEQNLQAALDPAELRPFHMQINNGFIKDALFYWDAIDNQWNQWVVGYDDKLQQDFLERIFNKKVNMSDTIIYMVIAFSTLMLLLSFFIMRPKHKTKIEPITKIYNVFCNTLAKQGIARATHEGPVNYASRAIKILPKYKGSIELIIRLYTKLRYEAHHNEKQFKQFKLLVKKFKPVK